MTGEVNWRVSGEMLRVVEAADSGLDRDLDELPHNGRDTLRNARLSDSHTYKHIIHMLTEAQGKAMKSLGAAVTPSLRICSVSSYY